MIKKEENFQNLLKIPFLITKNNYALEFLKLPLDQVSLTLALTFKNKLNVYFHNLDNLQKIQWQDPSKPKQLLRKSM